MKNSDLKKQIAIALKEIGPIEPWWSDDDNMYVFEHPLYEMCMHADPDRNETIAGYMRALTCFIEDRMNDNLDPVAERLTLGRGGKRPGAGRPKGTQKIPKKRVYLPIQIADWLQDEANQAKVQKLMQA